MADEQEYKGDEEGAYEKGRNDSLDLNIAPTEAEKDAKERGAEDKINADATREESEAADDED